MPQPKEQIEHVARLNLTTDGTKKLTLKLTTIAASFDQFNQADTEAAEWYSRFAKAADVSQEDKVRPSLRGGRAPGKAADCDSEHFLVSREIL